MGEHGSKIPTRSLPNILLRLVALFDGTVALVTPELGKMKPLTNNKAKTVLGWQPRSAEDALLASAKSVVEYGLIK
jgi:dihydroflavonol-4-reductase